MSLARKAMNSADLPEEEGAGLFWPRRELEIRKKGKRSSETEPLYPGYVFFKGHMDTGYYRLFKKVPGFIRFLKDNQNIEPLSREERQLLNHFLSFGEVAEQSKVYFNENNLIQVISGPLKGLEGRITRVNKRKKRAKVILTLYKENYPIDLGFELIVPAGENK